MPKALNISIIFFEISRVQKIPGPINPRILNPDDFFSGQTKRVLEFPSLSKMLANVLRG